MLSAINLPYATLQNYATEASTPEPPLLVALRKETCSNVHGSQMLVTPLQGRFLSLCSHLLKPRFILEIGTYTGYSALCLAEGIHPEGELHTIDKTCYPLSHRYIYKAGLQDKIHTHYGNAKELLSRLPPLPFELIFIDADKKNYPLYVEYSLARLRPGGMLILDNMFWKGEVCQSPPSDPRAQILQKLATQLSTAPGIATCMLPAGDGLLLIQKLL